MNGFAISGKAGTGKTTFAARLIEACAERSVPAVCVAFGDALKAEVFDLYGIEKNMVGGREVLVRHGEERRVADPDYWIRPVVERVRLAHVSGLVVVIDDVRFLREYAWALSVGLVTVRMVASEEWRWQKLTGQGLNGGHAYSKEVGETQLDAVRHQHVIRNFAGATLDARARVLVESVG